MHSSFFVICKYCYCPTNFHFSLIFNPVLHCNIPVLPKCHRCDQCGRLFTLKSGLKVHQMIIHTHCDKSYGRGKCGKSSIKLSRFIHHKCSHREDPHCCDQCGRSFASKKGPKVHQRDHKGDFQCKECGCSFIYINNLHVHQRMHKAHQPFRCDQCGQCFTKSSKLKRHLRIHTSGVRGGV